MFIGTHGYSIWSISELYCTRIHIRYGNMHAWGGTWAYLATLHSRILTNLSNRYCKCKYLEQINTVSRSVSHYILPPKTYSRNKAKFTTKNMEMFNLLHQATTKMRSSKYEYITCYLLWGWQFPDKGEREKLY